MPMFQYKCAKCEYVWAELVRKPEEEPTNCPHCDAPEDFFDKDIDGQRPIHIFKGKGFFTNDYKKRGK